MRTVKASILLGIAVMLIALAPLLRFYAMPHLEKQPLNFYYTDVGQGQGKYFDIGALKVAGPETITASRTERGDVSAGSSNVAVWDIFINVTNAAGTTINAEQDRWAFDRHSGESVSGHGSRPHTGLYLVFPFNAEKKTYPQYWDPVAKRAYPARYVDTEKVQGHTVYRYRTVVPPVKIGSTGIPGSLIGMPQLPTAEVDIVYSDPNLSVLVDPRTGAIVGGSQHEIETLRLPGASKDLLTVLDVNLVATPKSVAGLIKKAEDGANQLKLIGTWIPLVSLVLGIALAVVAVWWDRRSRVIELPEAGGAGPPEAGGAGPLEPDTAVIVLPSETTTEPPPRTTSPGSPLGD